MQLIHKNEQINIDNVETSINEVYIKINKLLGDKNIVFSHLLIDDVEVYENHEEYMKEHLIEIETIEIVTRKIKEMIWETMESIHSYLQRAVPALTELVDESYENFSSKSWEGINQLAEGMQWVLQFTAVTKTAPQQPANWEAIEKSLQQCETSFAQLLEAVEVKDTILISDILSYEVTPSFVSLEKELAVSLRDKGFLEDVN
ncbi:hypothetical protein [Oceanobacillus sp. CF4.6]|uniref:hypothetical protein n=1 Tax=Oceanobacillus sp. CF4.6 TaxID=3373080 RepID=UPI003EE61991